MPISKQKKVEIVKDLSQKVKGSETVVFVNFHGLSVANTTQLRRQLKAEGVGYTVAKKTLIRKAFETSGRAIAGDWPTLDGEVALAYLTVKDGDPISPAKGIHEFSAKGGPASGRQNLKILGGVFQGAFTDATMMMGIAAIPPRATLYAQLANLFNSPIQRLVIGLDQISKITKSE